MSRTPGAVWQSVLVVTILLVCFATSSVAQQAAVKPAEPVPLVPAAPRAPQLEADGKITFRLAMPNALKVELHVEGQAHPIPMAKGSDGVWSVTIAKLAPQYYSYTFNVDGVDVLDPHNTSIKTSFFSNQNIFLVPGQPAMPWEQVDVPHGVVNHHYYHSAIVGINSEYYVYTPPGFDPNNTQKYPVLYLLHGYSDDPSAWTTMGKANLIFDNLIAQGKGKPMIVVMPLGYGTMEVIDRGWVTWRDPELVRKNFMRFLDVLFQEVMPMVKQQYPLSENRKDHAIAGLSMGGSETLLAGLNHTDAFAYVGGFSSGGLGDGNFTSWFPAITPKSAAGINASLHLLWISCGTEDGLFAPNQKFIAWLKDQGVKVNAVQTPGMHAWMVWRDNLSNFAPLLFQTDK